MIRTRVLKNEGFVEIRLPDDAPLYGAAITWSTPQSPPTPCALYPGIDHDTLLDATYWTWNQAATFGRVKFAGKARPVFWNLYLNNLHAHRGPITLRADILRADGVHQHETTVNLEPTRAIYLDNWTQHVQPDSGWKVEGDRLTFAGEPGRPGPGNPRPPVAPLRIPVPRKGRFQIHIGLRNGLFAASLAHSAEPNHYPFIASPKHPELQDKVSKEIHWTTADLAVDAHIEIAPVPQSITDPKIVPFGSLAYIKLVPQPRRNAPTRPLTDRTLALYFEPYSWAYFFGLSTRQQVREAVALYREMGATELHNQIIRFGSRCLHHSRVAERFAAGAFMADDGTFSNRPTEMVQAIDVLRETIDACRDLGITHYTNAGLTNCYPGTDFEEKISREHPEYRQGNVLRYHRPETRAHAAAVMAEFVEWGTDGLSIDCMRYPDHHTEEDLLLLFREIRAAVDKAAAGRPIPLTVRLPASDPVYYRAFETLTRENAVQCVVPSTVWPREPYTSVKPYLRWKDHGCRVLGIVDGWKTWVGTFCDNYQLELLLHPRDIRADIRRHLRDGADGIYVYQADGHCADPFTRRTLLTARENP